LESELVSARALYQNALKQIQISQGQVDRLAKANGVVPLNTIEDRSVSTLGLANEAKKHEVTMQEHQRRLVAVNDQFAKSAEAFRTTEVTLKTQIKEVASRQEALELDLREIERRIVEDRERARVLTEREIEAAHHQLEALAREKMRLVETLKSRLRSPVRSCSGTHPPAWPRTTRPCSPSPSVRASTPASGCRKTRFTSLPRPARSSSPSITPY
jgi:predicted RNase H-like nuclease (RuvC/YqgF family)